MEEQKGPDDITPVKFAEYLQSDKCTVPDGIRWLIHQLVYVEKCVECCLMKAKNCCTRKFSGFKDHEEKSKNPLRPYNFTEENGISCSHGCTGAIIRSDLHKLIHDVTSHRPRKGSADIGINNSLGTSV